MVKPNAHIYFMGIGGTGMASVAGLAKAKGFHITGSDENLYPPMSTMLEELKIDVSTPYSADNLKNLDSPPDLIVVANALSRGNEEIEYMLNNSLKYTSFPEFLGASFLKERASVVVTGTHGKTTTTSILAHIFEELGEDPSYLIGGIPHNFSSSFKLGKGKIFAVEGDEYDTAFFDKNSKFLHYFPKFILFNNLEFDHADIFKDLQDIENQFHKLFKTIPTVSNIIANIDDPGVYNFLKKEKKLEKVVKVSTRGEQPDADIVVQTITPPTGSESEKWSSEILTKSWGKLNISTSLSGIHNIHNIAQVIGCLQAIDEDPSLDITIDPEKLIAAIDSFQGVARRLDKLCQIPSQKIEIYEDFAHHPTAVSLVLESYRMANPDKRLLVAFEPKNATSRRNIFTNRYADSLSKADKIYLGACPTDSRITEGQRMDTSELQQQIGDKASAFNKNEDLLDRLIEDIKPNDSVIFMSSGSFSGIQHKLPNHLQKKFHIGK